MSRFNQLYSGLFIETLDLTLKSNKELYMSIDFVFNALDDLLLRDKFGVVDLILSKIEIEKYPVDITLSFLTITCAAQEKLSTYESFYTKCLNYYSSYFGDEEFSKNLLRGLEYVDLST